jgi:HEAT repeat protein
MNLTSLALVLTLFSLLFWRGLEPTPKQKGEKIGVGLVAPATPPPPAAAPAASGDEQVLKAAYLPGSGPGLLDFLRKRMPPGPDKGHVAGLVKQLGDQDAAVRDRAAYELVCIGMPAVVPLRRVANAVETAESAEAARKCLAAIEGAEAAGVTMTVLRTIAAQKPDGAAETLLGFLPFAEDERVVQEVLDALAAVGRKDGKPDPALLKALDDAVPCRRAAAADVLCRYAAAGLGDSAATKRAVRPLLKDPRPTVRLHAALGLLRGYDGEAIEVLIDVLPDLPPAQRKQAEEYLTELAGDWAVAAPKGNDAISRQLRRDVWSAWWRGTDGARLIDEFRRRTPTDEEGAAVLDLIRKLDSESAEAREKASVELVALGPKAVSLLRRAAEGGAWSGDHDLSRRVGPAAAKCLALIEKDAPNPLPAAAVRLLTLRRPAGTVDALLAYLPFADSDDSAGLVRDVLVSAGFRDGTPDPALVRALEAKVAARRAAAAVALCKGGAATELPAVRKLLRDTDPDVRRRVGLALAGLNERDAVPVLIDLLAELPVQEAWEVEDYLARAAGEQAPATQLTADQAGRAKARDAWAAWWKENGDKVRLPGADEARYLGYLLVVETWDPARGTGRVLELNAAGKLRWQIDKIMQPYDAQLLPGDRVVVVEHNNGIWRVTERDRTGKVLWEKSCPNPFQVQRLRNGNTFIACRNQLLEVDRTGKEVLNVPRFNDYLMSARKFPDGQIALVNNQGQYARMDASGKEVKSGHVPFDFRFGIMGAEVLPGDRVLVSQNTGAGGKVTEYSADGKTVWEASMPQPGAPSRLPNGHTLVPQNGSNRVVELDRQGKVFKEWKDLPCRVYRVYGR